MKQAALLICLLAVASACLAQQDSAQAPKTVEELQKLQLSFSKP